MSDPAASPGIERTVGYARAFSATQALFTGPARGGALWTNADMTVSESAFDANSVSQPGPFLVTTSGGGALRAEGALSVNDGQFTNNTAIGSGGALSGGAVTLADVTFSGNIAHGRSMEGVYTNGASGGAVHAATLTAQRITGTDNRVDSDSAAALFSSPATPRSMQRCCATTR